ncbi:VC0807 family protein [Nocardioides sp. PD653]|uniref:VC0807 family protein n=1 Tax=Nocardioides sp. PD653 TaxID=393303 RepID=UPI0010553BD2|nr:VC0807 family protein [Nocardioides sp. PD653]
MPAPVLDPTVDEPRHCPSLGAVVRRVGLSLLVACAIPATLFYVCFRVNGVWTAIFVALGWSYGAIAWRALTGRRTSGLLILTAVVMTGRTLIALLTDSTFLYFLQPIISDGVISALFLLSLATARPMVARLAGDFYPMDHELSVRPRIRRLFWQLTLMWAALCLGKALMTLWLLQSQSLETFVLVKSVSVLSINAAAVAVTIGAAVLVARKEGLLAPRVMLAG